jgi:hypothetical protein
VYSLYEVGILAGDIGFVISEVDCPVTHRNADGIEACISHVLEVILDKESTVADMSGVLEMVSSTLDVYLQ